MAAMVLRDVKKATLLRKGKNWTKEILRGLAYPRTEPP